MEIIIKVNGRRIAEQIEPDLLLIDFLRTVHRPQFAVSQPLFTL